MENGTNTEVTQVETTELKGLRVNEVYGPTFQGEGPFTGHQTLFLRMSGCNLRCPGWGVETTLPNGEVVTGCDTPRAVFPQLYQGTPFRQVEEILEMIPPRTLGVDRICLTGGEPLFGETESLNWLLDELTGQGYRVDIFTNGTMPLEKIHFQDRPTVFVTMDFKMPGSGEYNQESERNRKAFLYDNVLQLTSDDAIKFVIKDREDFDVACHEWSKIVHLIETEGGDQSFIPHFYVGAVFGLMDNDTLMEWVFESGIPFRMQWQAHKYDSNLDQNELTKRFDTLKKPEPNTHLLTNIKGNKKYQGPKEG